MNTLFGIVVLLAFKERAAISSNADKKRLKVLKALLADRASNASLEEPCPGFSTAAEDFQVLIAIDDRYNTVLTENLLTSAEVVGYHAPTSIVAMGPTTLAWCRGQQASRPSLGCVDGRVQLEAEQANLARTHGPRSVVDCRETSHAQGACFAAFFIAKVKLIRETLRSGCKPVLWLDSDTAFVSNPPWLPTVLHARARGGPVDILAAACEAYPPIQYKKTFNGTLVLAALERIVADKDADKVNALVPTLNKDGFFLEKNVGVVVYTPTPGVLLLLEAWSDAMTLYPHSFEQLVFNVLLMLQQSATPEALRVRLRCLPGELSGSFCFSGPGQDGNPLASRPRPPWVLHATCVSPQEKASALANHGGWFLKDNEEELELEL